jgi:phosphate:Na+ symporter
MKISIESYALPMAGIGLLLWTTGGSSRRGAFGQVIGGFGLFFLGLSFMQDAFGGLAEATDLSQFHPDGISGVLIFLGIGAILTTLVQSSSAAIAITLTAAMQGVIGPLNAGAMVIGANLGTTSTAMLSVIGATPDARRTASAHVFFNLITAGVALCLLPWLMDLVEHLVEAILDHEASLPVLLAVFHTTFNVVGVLLMFPLGGWLVRFLGRRFRTAEEEEGTPRHLDASVLQVPTLAVDALHLETKRLGHIAADMVRAALDERPATVDLIARRKETFNRLLAAISASVQQLDRSALPPEVPFGIQRSVHATQHFLMAAEQAEVVASHRAEAAQLAHFKLPSGLVEVLRAARGVVSLADPGSPEYSVNAASHALGVLDERVKTLQQMNIAEAAQGKRTARDVAWFQQLMTEARRSARRMVRAGEIMSSEPE